MDINFIGLSSKTNSNPAKIALLQPHWKCLQILPPKTSKLCVMKIKILKCSKIDTPGNNRIRGNRLFIDTLKLLFAFGAYGVQVRDRFIQIEDVTSQGILYSKFLAI